MLKRGEKAITVDDYRASFTVAATKEFEKRFGECKGMDVFFDGNYLRFYKNNTKPMSAVCKSGFNRDRLIMAFIGIRTKGRVAGKVIQNGSYRLWFADDHAFIEWGCPIAFRW